MYPDPKKIKDNRYTFRLDDYENDMLLRLVNTLGEQPATLIRNILMSAVNAELAKLDTTIISQSHPGWKRQNIGKLSAVNCWRSPC